MNRLRRRLLWFAIGLLVGMAGGWLYLRHRPAPPRAPTPAPTATAPGRTTPPAEVPIQEGKTIDFSSGQAEVRATDADRAALERAKREMDEATKDVTFSPTKPAPKKQ